VIEYNNVYKFEVLRVSMDLLKYFRGKPLCHEDCFYYGCFGGAEGCDVQNGGWGGWPERIEPGQKCLYPGKRSVSKPIIISSLEFCAALEGVPRVDSSGQPTGFTKRLLDLDSGAQTSR